LDSLIPIRSAWRPSSRKAGQIPFAASQAAQVTFEQAQGKRRMARRSVNLAADGGVEHQPAGQFSRAAYAARLARSGFGGSFTGGPHRRD